MKKEALGRKEVHTKKNVIFEQGLHVLFIVFKKYFLFLFFQI